MRKGNIAAVLLASALTLLAGLAIAWIDTRPRWDDAGITAGALAIAAAVGGFTRVPPLLAALLAAGPLVIAEFPGRGGLAIAIPNRDRECVCWCSSSSSNRGLLASSA